MKVLFFMTHSGYARNFESTLRSLAQRGHKLHVAFDRHKTGEHDQSRIIEGLAREFDAVTYGRAPERDDDRWSILAKHLRLAIDYLRFLRPPYQHAPKLRERAEAKVPHRVRRFAALPIVRTAAGLRLLAAVLRRLERAVPTSSAVNRFIEEHAPDIVLVTPLLELGSAQVDYLRSAKALGVHTGLCVFSWDNLTNKGLIGEVPDFVAVWNEAQRDEAVELHGVPASRVVTTGAPAYDHWFDWGPQTTREEFAERVGIRPERPLLLYLGSSPFIAPDEVGFVRRWIKALRQRPEQSLREAGIVIRPHPLTGKEWEALGVSDMDNVALWPLSGVNPTDERSKAEYYDSIFHSAAVVGVNTSALIESAIVGRPVHTLLAPEYRETQEGTLHFHHLVNVNGGLLHVADAIDDHAAQLVRALQSPSEQDDRSRRFIEAFVRPFGIEVPATPELVALIERTSASQPAKRRRPPLIVAKIALSPLASLAARYEQQRRKALVKHRERSRPGGKPKDDARRRFKSTAEGKATRAKASPDEVQSSRRLVAQLAKQDRPIIAGPWSSEVGFEVLYWIPFLRWAVAEHPEIAERLVVLSRGGAADWYQGVTSRYVDLFSDLSPAEFRDRKQQAMKRQGGKQKQWELTSLDEEMSARAKRAVGLDDAALLHPSAIYRVYWYLAKRHALTRISEVSAYERFAPTGDEALAATLPDHYVAVRFYFNHSFPSTEENRRAIASIIGALTDRTDVVLLNTGIELDDHMDFADVQSKRVFRIDQLMRPDNNLHVQTVAIERADAFVGTYGGLSYLPALYGKDSLCFYSDPDRFNRHHLDVAHRIFDRAEFGRFLPLDVADGSLLGLVGGALNDLVAGNGHPEPDRWRWPWGSRRDAAPR